MLELYHALSCPYCIKVTDYLAETGIKYVSKVTPLGSATNAAKEELRKLGGKIQVPFLADTEKNVQMYESDDIIAYLEKNYGGK